MTAEPTRVVVARRLLPVVAVLLVVAVLVQIFLAGLGTFSGPHWWGRHLRFVHQFGALSPIAVLLAYLARASRATKGFAWLTLVLIAVQYTTAGARGAAGRAGFAALHPVGAALLFWASMELLRRSRGR